MRTLPTILLCLAAAACSTLPPPEDEPPPDETQLKVGLAGVVAESHFAKPIEVTDVIRAPVSSTQPWMVCVRSASSDEARRLIYAAFFGKDSKGKYGQYLRSRYSVSAENCETQTYHPYAEPTAAPPAPPPGPPPQQKKHHTHQQ
jgi:hypothetical protein